MRRAAKGDGPDAPELLFGYLDDVLLIAGHQTQVALALERFARKAQEVGLRINLAKCELVLAAGDQSTVNVAAFPDGMKVNRSGCFELLGAPLDGLNDFGVPVGSSAYCDAFTRSTRLGRAQACLDALADLPDAQTALLLPWLLVCSLDINRLA